MFLVMRAFYAFFSQRKALLAQYVVQRGKYAANTGVLGMGAKGMDACNNVYCSTPLRSMLYKEKRCKYQRFGHGRKRHGSSPHPPP